MFDQIDPAQIALQGENLLSRLPGFIGETVRADSASPFAFRDTMRTSAGDHETSTAAILAPLGPNWGESLSPLSNLPSAIDQEIGFLVGSIDGASPARTGALANAPVAELPLEGEMFLLSLLEDMGEGDLSVSASSGEGNYIDENGNGQYDEGETLLVTHEREDEFNGGGGGYYPGGGGGGGTGDGGGFNDPADDFEECQDTSTMTPEQREDYEVAREAAEIAREIQAAAERDSREYGALIYRDANGTITHTPLIPGGATSVSNWPNTDGFDYSTVLGVVHSHPASGFASDSPYQRLIPTPDQGAVGGQGDWAFFNSVQAHIIYDLVYTHGYSQTAASARAGQLVQFVYGATDMSGTGRYALYRYEDSDESHQTTSSANQVANGDHVNTILGTCGG